jgi:hypothetical protein
MLKLYNIKHAAGIGFVTLADAPYLTKIYKQMPLLLQWQLLFPVLNFLFIVMYLFINALQMNGQSKYHKRMYLYTSVYYTE